MAFWTVARGDEFDESETETALALGSYAFTSLNRIVVRDVRNDTIIQYWNY